MIGLHRVRPQIDGKFRFDAQQIAPLYSPVVREFVSFQQAVNQYATFLRVVIFQEALHFLGGRQRADHIQVDAPHEDAVRASGCRLNSQRLELRQNRLVDAVERGRCRAGFERGRR